MESSPKDWDGYKRYIDYFFEIAISAGIIAGKPIGNKPDIEKTVRGLKNVDKALFAFGQFLSSYG